MGQLERSRTGHAPVLEERRKGGLLRLSLATDLQAWSDHGIDVTPSARKARALLALLALSDGHSVSRRFAAATLWSDHERASGLGRLRDILYHLQKKLLRHEIDAIRVEAKHLAFAIESVRIEVNNGTGSRPKHARISEFLADLEGVDAQFDSWILRLREKFDKNSEPTADHPNHGEIAGSPMRKSRGPSIILADFDEIGIQNQQFAHVLREEIAAKLAKYRWIRVITLSSNMGHFTNGKASEKDFDYVLSGVIQHKKNLIKTSFKLLDISQGGSVMWTSELNTTMTVGFTLQENISTFVASNLESHLIHIESERMTSNSLHQSNSAYSLLLQAMPAIGRLEKGPFISAGHMLEQAITIDRDFSLAHTWLAYWYLFLVGQGWAINPAQAMMRADKVAERAMILDPKDARSLTIAGHIKAYLSRRLDEASSLHEQALRLNPALGLAWHLAAVTHAYAGRLDEGLRFILRARELAPDDPHSFYSEGALGLLHLLRGEHKEAVAIGRLVTQRCPNFTSAYKSYLAALGHLGLGGEARIVLQRLCIREPRFSLRHFVATSPYRRKQELDHFIKGLRLAGVK